MRLSTRARYGLRMCFMIALSNEPLSLPTLIKQTDLSVKYSEQLLLKLKKAGIIKTVRGASGGYYLADSADKITVKSLLEALDDGLDISDCVKGKCEDKYCPNRKILFRIYHSINDVLQNTTLQDMINDYKCV